jgi:hypothetical protein
MLRAYLDESGSYGDTRVLAVAGYIATPAEWRRLELDWDLAMREFGLRNGFHMTDFECRQGEFKKLSNDDRARLIARLVDLILRRNMRGFGSAVLLSDYDVVAPSDRDGILRSPYLLCFEHCVREMASLAAWQSDRTGNSPEADKVKFICDQHSQYSRPAVRRYNGLKMDERWANRKRLGPISFESSRTNMPLQVADILAYEAFKHIDNSRYSERRVRVSVRRLARVEKGGVQGPNSPVQFRYFNRSELLKHISRGGFGYG